MCVKSSVSTLFRSTFAVAIVLWGMSLAAPVMAFDETAEAESPAEESPAEAAPEGEDHSAEDHSDDLGNDHSDDHEGGHGDGHEGGHDTGVPINFKTDLALWSLVTFVLFLFVLRKAAWGPMIEGLDSREASLRAAIAEADENQRKSQALLAEYEDKLRNAEQTVSDMLAEAKRDAERTTSDMVAKAQDEVEALRNRATEDIGQAKDTALAEVFSSVNAQVAMATERVLGRALSDEDQERLIQEALSEIGA